MKQSIISHVLIKYPPSEAFKDLSTFLEEYNKMYPITTSKNFAEAFSAYELKMDPTITISKSGCYAVCQAYLGKLFGFELIYANSRSGIWNMRTEKHADGTFDTKIISMSDILEDLMLIYG
jgi:hypothetical protein